MAEQTTSSIVVDAPASEVMDVIADFESYPSWATGVRRVEITEPGDDPTRAKSVFFSLDVAIPLIGMLKRKGEKILIDAALKGLKKRVESL